MVISEGDKIIFHRFFGFTIFNDNPMVKISNKDFSIYRNKYYPFLFEKFNLKEVLLKEEKRDRDIIECYNNIDSYDDYEEELIESLKN